MQILFNWVLSTLAVVASAYLLKGVHVFGLKAAFVIALVLGIVNAVLKPLLLALTLPINVLTLGLFTLVINAALIELTALLVPGFAIENFWWAILFGLVLSVINSALHHLSR